MTGRFAAKILILGGLTGPAWAAGDTTRGGEIYTKRCSQCHGDEGGGDGPAAFTMLPRPRVFQQSAYKIRRTGSGELPTEQDLYDIITLGLPGSSMPGFDMLSDQETWDVVAYVRSLSPDFADPDYLSTATALPELAGDVQVPAATPELIERGEAVYTENQCFKCHGEVGRGDGQQWADLDDDWDNVIVPANLTNREHFRGGGSALDIFRTVSTGLNGTPMPSYRDSVSVEDRWAMVHYIISLGPEEREQRDERVLAIRVAEVPSSGTDAGWDTVPEARFETVSNIVEAPRLYFPSVEFVTVQAVYTDEELALRVRWDDRSNSTGSDEETVYEDEDGEPYLATDHPDQIAIQFPSRLDDSARPYFMMGDRKRAVNLWWWRADTNQTQEVTAKGFGKFSVQADESQGLTSTVVFDKGQYTMLVRRSLATENPGDMQFEVGRFVPIAFNLWDGHRGELGQRRALTTWYWLFLQPEVPQTAYTYPVFAFLITLGVLLGVVRSTRSRASAAPSGAAGAQQAGGPDSPTPSSEADTAAAGDSSDQDGGDASSGDDGEA